MQRSLLLTVAFFTCSVAPAQAQDPAGGGLQEVIDRVAHAYLKDGSLEFVSIGVAVGDRSLTGHYGPLYRGKQASATDSTIFEARSITKTFTGTLAAQGILDGRLSLNDDIRQYLEGSYSNLEFEGKPILLRHLLTHTSGLPSNNPEMEAAHGARPDGDARGELWRAIRDAELAMTPERFLENLGRFTLKAAPGEQFNYSNLGTNLVAHILERVYERPFAELLDQYITGPAGLEEAALSIEDKGALERLAGGYNAAGQYVEPWPTWPMWGAEGAIKATVPDVIRYMRFHIAEKAPAVKLSHVPLHQIDVGYSIACFWWIIDTPEGQVSLRHDGGYANVRNVMILYPAEELGIYVVSNRVTEKANATLTRLVADLRKAIGQLD